MSEAGALQALPSPWAQFLDKVDELLPRPVELHCLGGFVLTVLYGLPRPTGDIDYISVIPSNEVGTIEAIAGANSELAKKYKIHVQFVTIAEVPDNYETRLIEIPQRYSKLRLFALDPHDIVLSKLTRNTARDDGDVAFLASKGVLKPAVLKERYEKELRPRLGNVERHDLTLQLWVESYLAKC